MSAEAMREAAAMIAESQAKATVDGEFMNGVVNCADRLAEAIRAIPIPPDPAREELLAALKDIADYPATPPIICHMARAAISKAEPKP